MNKHGYKQVSGLLGGFGRGYRNNLGTIGDVSFRNLGYTPEGELRMFDMLAKKNGGKLNLRQKGKNKFDPHTPFTEYGLPPLTLIRK